MIILTGYTTNIERLPVRLISFFRKIQKTEKCVTMYKVEFKYNDTWIKHFESADYAEVRDNFYVLTGYVEKTEEA